MDEGAAAVSGERPIYIAEVGRGETCYAAGWHLKVRFVPAGGGLPTHSLMGASRKQATARCCTDQSTDIQLTVID